MSEIPHPSPATRAALDQAEAAAKGRATEMGLALGAVGWYGFEGGNERETAAAATLALEEAARALARGFLPVLVPVTTPEGLALGIGVAKRAEVES
jgi:ammonia channel protein AmtB